MNNQFSFINVKYLNNQDLYHNITLDNPHSCIDKKFNNFPKKMYSYKFFTKDIANEHYQKLSIHELVGSLVNIYQEKMKSYEIKLSITLDINPNFQMECKPSLMMQVFFYLLNNSIQAIKFKKYKWIHINIKEFYNDIEISFSDNSSMVKRQLDENQKLDIISNCENLNTEEESTFENFKFIKDFFYSQGGDVSFDLTEENTKILFYLPKRSFQYHN